MSVTVDTQIEQLKSYIRQQVQLGISSNEISEQLKGAGWPNDQIYNAFLALQQEMMPAHLAQHHQPATQHTPAASSEQPSVPQANGQKRGRLKMGWLLLKQSFRILNGNRYLLRYLLMTGVWVFAITAAFVIIYVLYEVNSTGDVYAEGASFASNFVFYVLAFLNYLLIYFFINLYAAGLAANILDIFAGKRRHYNDYMHMAYSKAGPIFVFSLIQATVGMILDYIVERLRFVGWILSWVLGMLWSLGTMFVIPIMMTSQKPSAVRSIGQSMRFFKGTWGENVVAKAGVNVPLGLISFVSVFVMFILIFPAYAVASVWGALFVVVLWFVFIIALSIVGSFANSLINVSLYYYAVHQKVPPSFSAEMLNSVLVKGKSRFFKKNKQ